MARRDRSGGPDRTQATDRTAAGNSGGAGSDRVAAGRRWSPGDLESVGTRPDYRFSLANERTFLAWIRTALALAAGGLAVDQFVTWPGFAGVRAGLATALLLLALVAAATSWQRWYRSERAMRLDQDLPRTPISRVLAYGVAAVILAAVVGVIVATVRDGAV